MSFLFSSDLLSVTHLKKQVSSERRTSTENSKESNAATNFVKQIVTGKNGVWSDGQDLGSDWGEYDLFFSSKEIKVEAKICSKLMTWCLE